MSEQCAERVYRGGGWHSVQCSRKAKVTRDGKGYCTQHDPVRVAQKRKDETAKWKAESATRNAERHRRDLERQACEGISNEALDDGVIQEMVVLMKGMARGHSGGINKALDNACDGCIAHDILAKLGKEETHA